MEGFSESGHKYGLHKILEPFVKDLNILATTGVQVRVDGIERMYKEALLTFLVDNLGSNALGFKESFSFSLRYCQTGLGTSDEVKSTQMTLSYEPVIPMTSMHCKHLESEAKSHFSTTYGINIRSCLMDVNF